MYKVIMAPTEGSDSESVAISAAVKLAQRFEADLRLVRVRSAPLILETIAQTPVIPTEEILLEERLAHLRKLEALGTECRALGEVRVITALEDGPVGPTLRDYAEKFHVDLIVMSSHSRGGLKRIALGSVTDFLIRRTNIPVLVVRPPVSFISATQQQTVGRIVVALDGSELAGQILPPVAALALRLGSTVSLLHVLTPMTYSQKEIMQPGLPWWDADIAAADAYLTRAASYLSEEGLAVSKDVVLSDDIATAILDYSARTRADIIALATSGCGGMSRLAFGTVADEVSRKSTSSLLVFHPKVPFETDAVEPSSATALAGVRHD
jgi:nucleotide-binding universal stress UspA family protein